MAEEIFALTYNGGDADAGRLSFYDASVSYRGFARTLSILGHYYTTGQIIAQAPRANLEIYIVPPQEGSFRQNVIAAVVGGVIAVPFVKFTEAAIENWFPKNDPQMAQIIQLLEDNNRILAKQRGMSSQMEDEQANEAREIVRSRQPEIDVLRSVTSNSFRDIFRPVGRSVDRMSITGGATERPIGTVTPATLALIESDVLDERTHTIVGIVSAFSRNSKTGVIFSEEMGRGFRFEFMGAERLKKEDIFSWSQFRQSPIAISGSFVYFHDGTIKKMLVYHAQPTEDFES